MRRLPGPENLLPWFVILVALAALVAWQLGWASLATAVEAQPATSACQSVVVEYRTVVDEAGASKVGPIYELRCPQS
jgi:hypothetical protein